MEVKKPWTDFIPELSDDMVEVYRDAFPVTDGHLLFVPKDNDPANLTMCFLRAQMLGDDLVFGKYCDGYNLGINVGESAGQTIGWYHVHLIPRKIGDCDDPRGGVRGVIPDRMNYKKSPHYKEVRAKLGIKEEK